MDYHGFTEVKSFISSLLSTAKEEAKGEMIANASGFIETTIAREQGRQETLKKVIEIVKEHDPAHGTGTGKNYWGNTLLAALTKELNQHY